MADREPALMTQLRRLARTEAAKAVEPLKAEIAELRKRLSNRGASPTRKQAKRARTTRRATSAAGRSAPSRKSTSTTGARLTPESIRAHRKRLGLTQEQFSLLADVTPLAVYLWESGRTKPTGTRVDALVRIRRMNAARAQRRVKRLQAG